MTSPAIPRPSSLPSSTPPAKPAPMPPTRCLSKAFPPASPTGWASWRMSSGRKAPIWACASSSARRSPSSPRPIFPPTRWPACPTAPSPWRGWRRKTSSPAWRPRTGWRTPFPQLDLEDAAEPSAETADRTRPHRRRRGDGGARRHQFRRRRRLLLAQRRGAGHQRRAFTAAMPAPATASASRCWPAKAPAWNATMTMPAPAMPRDLRSRRRDRPHAPARTPSSASIRAR